MTGVDVDVVSASCCDRFGAVDGARCAVDHGEKAVIRAGDCERGRATAYFEGTAVVVAGDKHLGDACPLLDIESWGGTTAVVSGFHLAHRGVKIHPPKGSTVDGPVNVTFQIGTPSAVNLTSKIDIIAVGIVIP